MSSHRAPAAAAGRRGVTTLPLAACLLSFSAETACFRRFGRLWPSVQTSCGCVCASQGEQANLTQTGGSSQYLSAHHLPTAALRPLPARPSVLPGSLQIVEDTQADGVYSSTLTVVTVEPAGLSPPGADLTGKLRLLLVSEREGKGRRQRSSSERFARDCTAVELTRCPGCRQTCGLDAPAVPARVSPSTAAHRPPCTHFRAAQNFGEHGRELISSEIGLNVLRLLCDAEARAPLLAKYKIDPNALASALQRAVFKVRRDGIRTCAWCIVCGCLLSAGGRWPEGEEVWLCKPGMLQRRAFSVRHGALPQSAPH